MKFVDETKIYIESGTGGDGIVAFLRERHRPKGGPSGGDGGKGADIVFVADSNLSTLLDYRFSQHHRAKGGQSGSGKCRHGADADDLVLRVPVGTVIKDAQTGQALHDLAASGERWVAMKGGKGGRGNARFATSVNQAPRRCENGGANEAAWVRLELKLVADVGLVGFPNAGKSSFISKVSAARPKIAEYPFTTLVPVLGVVRVAGEPFVVADIPGLVQGAHQGTGLGTRFLRHAERTRLFVHVVDLTDESPGGPLGRFHIIEEELKKYESGNLADKPRIVALNKIDDPRAQACVDEVMKSFQERGLDVYPISALTGEGLDPLLYAIHGQLTKSAVTTVRSTGEGL